MKNNTTFSAHIMLLFLICFVRPLFGQIPISGESKASPAERENARKAVEANPDNLQAHKTYLFAMGLSNPLIVPQYEKWMTKYPKDVNIPLSIGTVYYNAEMPQPKDFLLRASVMQPGNAKVWIMLAADAGMKGQNNLLAEYIKKAMLADTSNAKYAFSYVMTFEDEDLNIFKQKVFDFAKRFPTSNYGAEALYWLAEKYTGIDDRIKYFENLRKLYPPKKFDWSASGMEALADAYLQTNPEKALLLISEMDGNDDWQIRQKLAESLIQINKLELNQDYKEAIVKINQIKLPSFNYLSDFIALKKSSILEKAGDVKAAYNNLAIKFAQLPTDRLDTALKFYGEKMGKNKELIANDIVHIRDSTATRAYPFELDCYTSNDKLSLNDFKGKVILLTFWFPDCGPCRQEFPHFQAVINKFKGSDVVYLGINVSTLEDPYVIPFLKNNKYSFIPLRGNAQFARDNFGVNGEPENFLIDKDGNIIFKGFRIDNTNHRTLELMISSLLKRDQ